MRKAMVKKKNNKVKKKVKKVIIQSKDSLRDLDWNCSGKRRYLVRTNLLYFIKKDVYV